MQADETNELLTNLSPIPSPPKSLSRATHFCVLGNTSTRHKAAVYSVENIPINSVLSVISPFPISLYNATHSLLFLKESSGVAECNIGQVWVYNASSEAESRQQTHLTNHSQK